MKSAELKELLIVKTHIREKFGYFLLTLAGAGLGFGVSQADAFIPGCMKAFTGSLLLWLSSMTAGVIAIDSLLSKLVDRFEIATSTAADVDISIAQFRKCIPRHDMISLLQRIQLMLLLFGVSNFSVALLGAKALKSDSSSQIGKLMCATSILPI